MKFSELIEHAIECLKTFNPVIKTIDSHADEMIAKVRTPPTYLICFSYGSSRTPMRKSSLNKFSTAVHDIRSSSK